MALSLLPTAALAEEATGAGPIKVGETSYSSFSDAVNAAEPDESGVITYKISGKVDVTDIGWVQVAKAGLPDLSKVEFIGITDDAEICITQGVAILADQSYDIDVSFEALKLTKLNPQWAGDFGHSTNYFTCWLRNTGRAENTVTYTNCTFPNGVCNNQYGKTVFNNCQFTNSANYNLWNYGGNTEVKNSAFIGVRGIKTYNEGTLAVAPTVKIEQTTFSGLTEKAAIVASKATDITLTNVTATGCIKGLLQKDIEGSTTDEQKVTIEANGTGISGDFNITAEMDAEAAKNEFNITAGTFPGGINNDYLAPGANFDATTGEVKMSYVAKIGDTEYPTLADAFAAANKTGDTVIELLDDINMTGKNWTPVSVDGNHGQGVITLNGNGKTITGLSAPLFAGGFAGKSGIVIRDLTIADADINDPTNDQGIGAFINCVDSMPRIELDNCHLKNSKIVSTGGARVGGLIGWTSGYNKPNDGPVDTKVTLTNCSVEDVTIEAKGSVGGLIGHAGANPATYHTITGCTVKDSTLKCTETGKSWRVGDLVGTANVGQVTVDAATSASQNTLTQENADPQKPKDSIFGRDAVNDTGLVIVDNKVVAAGTAYGKIVNKNANEVLVEVSKGHWMKPAENTVAMIGATEYLSLPDAITAAKDGETITLVKAVELTSTLSITADKKITLDLNGCKISADMNGPHMICNAGNLTITDSSAAKTGEIAKVGDASNYGYVIENHGTMLLDSCKITSTSSVSSAIENGWYTPAQNTSGTNCTMTIQNAEVTSVNAAGGLYTVKNDDYGVMVINGGIFTNGTEGAGAVLNWNNLTIHNGTFTGTSAVRTLKSGTNDYESGRTYIYDGTFNGKIDTLAGYGENIDVNISGGSFSQPVKEEYCADGFIPKDNGNGTYGVKTGTYAAKIGDTKYESLEVAVSNVTADETITLLQDVPAESVITVARTISFKVDINKSDGSGVYAFAADTNIIKGNNTTLTTAVESNVYTYSFVYTAPSSSGSSGYYVSTPSKTEHGTVTVSPRYADKGDTVTVTVKPDSGYVLGSLTVTDSKGNELTLTDKGNGKYTFVMPAGKVEVKASFAKEIETSPFADVATDAYYYEAVKWAVGKGITTGVGNDLFAPEQPCTRAQIVTFLWRAAGSPEPKGTASGMTDVVSGSYYEKAVAWAIENGVTTGTTTSTFSPDATCTRAQAVTFLARALNAKAASAAEFSDVPTDSYFADAVAWAASNGVTEGIGGGLFGSDNDCTRGQIVTFLYRAYNK